MSNGLSRKANFTTDFTDRSQRAGGSVQTRLGLSANRDALAMALAACGLRRVIDVTVA